MVCRVCSSPDRAEIDRSLVSGTGSDRTIATRFGLSRQSIARHRVNHLPATLVVEDDARRRDDAADLRSGVAALTSLVPVAVATLRTVLTDAAISPAVRVRAAETVLSRVLLLRELVDHEDRLAALEAGPRDAE
jgi:hypothetical protein